MGVTSEILGNSGPAHAIEYQGEVFALRLIDDATASAFEKQRFAEARAALNLVAGEKGLTRDEYASRLAQIADRYHNGDYEMISDAGLAFLSTVQGNIYLLAMLTGKPRKAVARMVMAKRDEVKSMTRLILKESFPGLKFQDEEAAENGEAGYPNG